MKGRKDGTSPLTINQGMVELGHELGNVLNGLARHDTAGS